MAFDLRLRMRSKRGRAAKPMRSTSPRNVRKKGREPSYGGSRSGARITRLQKMHSMTKINASNAQRGSGVARRGLLCKSCM